MAAVPRSAEIRRPVRCGLASRARRRTAAHSDADGGGRGTSGTASAPSGPATICRTFARLVAWRTPSSPAMRSVRVPRTARPSGPIGSGRLIATTITSSPPKSRRKSASARRSSGRAEFIDAVLCSCRTPTASHADGTASAAVATNRIGRPRPSTRASKTRAREDSGGFTGARRLPRARRRESRDPFGVDHGRRERYTIRAPGGNGRGHRCREAVAGAAGGFQPCHRLPTAPSPRCGYIPPQEGVSLSIVLEHLTKTYGGQSVVRDVSLEIGDGELCVFLGPSGSGKSTILRIVAGLTDSDSGRVLLHGRDVTRVPPQKRGVGFVFQHYALFRHMTIADNVEFALRVRRVAPAERAQRRDELLEMVGLGGYGARRPDQLSGGQQQRVALARALAHRPEVLLLDEPFGALDARIRAEIRSTVRRIQRELGVTMIFVTHDQEEAFELADRIAVLNHGRLLERGSPRELYLHPSTEFTATFLGTANLVVAERSKRGLRVGEVDLPVGAPGLASTAPQAGPPAPPAESARVQLLFRPEDVAVKDSPDALQWPLLGEGIVEESTFVGAFERLRLRLPLKGVRVLAPAAPFGAEYVIVEAVRSQHLAHRYPLRAGDTTWVGLRRVHSLAHPGMAFLVVDDGSPAAEAAILLGGRIARLARSRTTRLACGPAASRTPAGDEPVIRDPDSLEEGLRRHAPRGAYDLVVAGIAAGSGPEVGSADLRHGDQNMLQVGRAHV